MDMAHSDMTKAKRRSVCPGFGLTMGYTVIYLSLIALIPLSTLFCLKTSGIGWAHFWHVVLSPRVLAAYRLSLGASLTAAHNQFGLRLYRGLDAVRYDFP